MFSFFYCAHHWPLARYITLDRPIVTSRITTKSHYSSFINKAPFPFLFFFFPFIQFITLTPWLLKFYWYATTMTHLSRRAHRSTRSQNPVHTFLKTTRSFLYPFLDTQYQPIDLYTALTTMLPFFTTRKKINQLNRTFLIDRKQQTHARYKCSIVIHTPTRQSPSILTTSSGSRPKRVYLCMQLHSRQPSKKDINTNYSRALKTRASEGAVKMRVWFSPGRPAYK